MVPCVGQAAVGIEIRENDERITGVCERLNHYDTYQCVTAERAFLHEMGGGCLSPVAALAEVTGEQLRLRAVSFRQGPCRRAEGRRDIREPSLLGKDVAAQLA
jgi:porphobilinogen deaminase